MRLLVLFVLLPLVLANSPLYSPATFEFECQSRCTDGCEEDFEHTLPYFHIILNETSLILQEDDLYSDQFVWYAKGEMNYSLSQLVASNISIVYQELCEKQAVPWFDTKTSELFFEQTIANALQVGYGKQERIKIITNINGDVELPTWIYDESQTPRLDSAAARNNLTVQEFTSKEGFVARVTRVSFLIIVVCLGIAIIIYFAHRHKPKSF